VLQPLTRLTFISDDRKSYDANFTASARAQLLTLLQSEVARRREQDLIPLTLTPTSVAVSALGTALVVETMEAGPIAFRISLEEIANLRLTLAQLETFPDPQSRM
jgi:hypothetical protein